MIHRSFSLKPIVNFHEANSTLHVVKTNYYFYTKFCINLPQIRKDLLAKTLTNMTAYSIIINLQTTMRKMQGR